MTVDDSRGTEKGDREGGDRERGQGRERTEETREQKRLETRD